MKFKNLKSYYRSQKNGLAWMDRENGEVQEELNSIGGWKGLFSAWEPGTDCRPFVDYNDNDIGWTEECIYQKWKVIQRLKTLMQCTLAELIHLYSKDMQEKDSFYLGEIPVAIAHYGRFYEEAKQILEKEKWDIYYDAQGVPFLYGCRKLSDQEWARRQNRRRRITDPFEPSMWVSELTYAR